MTPDDSFSFEQSKQRILDAIGEPIDLTFVRGFGNIGDLLIHSAGIRQMLSSLDYREISIFNLVASEGIRQFFPVRAAFAMHTIKSPLTLPSSNALSA